jgi:hypothetical protein
VPNDARAIAGLRGAEFEVHMAKGRQAAVGKRFPEAVKEFEEALELSPGSTDAKAALQRAREGKP